MRLFCCVILGFTFVVNSKQLNEKVKQHNKPVEYELTFNDVIQNISSVNDVLKDLIKNYKHLKKIFESDESKQDKQASNSLEDIFEESNVKRKRNRNDDPNSEENTNKLDSYHVTQMYYSEEKNVEKPTKELNVSYDNEETSTDSNTSEEISKENSKHGIRKKKKNKKESDGLEIPVFDEANVKEEDIPNNDKAVIERFSNTIQLVKRTVLQPKGNKQSDTMNTDTVRQNWSNYHNMRRIPAQPPLIMIANSSGFNQRYDELIDQKDDNAFINSEQFKTDILRSTFSDACLKLVVRKCYRACKKVIKLVCRHYKCNKDFKSKYDTYAKRGCIKYFDAEEKNSYKEFRVGKDVTDEDFTRGGNLAATCFPYKEANNQKLRAKNETKIKMNTGEQHEFRVYDGEKHITLRNETITSTIEDPNTNILRNRLEKECLKISNSKCKKACSFAYTEACKVQKCNTDKKREFKKECKDHCKRSFDDKDDSSCTDTDSSSSGSSSSSSSS